MNIYASRRQKLMDTLEDHSYVILFSGRSINKSEDETYPFDVNRSFYYYTGIKNEGLILLIQKRNNIINSKMFIPPFDEVLAKWVGGRMKKDEVIEISAVDDVDYIDSFEDHLAYLYNYERSFNGLSVYLDLWHYSALQSATLASELANKIISRYPSSTIKDIYPNIANMRMIKDEIEVEEIKKAISITKTGIEAMMRNIKPNLNEMVMEGIFNFALMQRGCKKNAFSTIAAGGKNATVLHYSENECILNDGDLFLCDLGATSNLYCADISRTFPVNGKFSDRQKEIYNIVLGAQDIVEINAKPGVSIRDLNAMVCDYYAEELPKVGLNKEVREYYFHSIGHQLGLDTHDINNAAKNTVLEKGMVITNEPGLYIEDECIGIRIEDDLLITENGCVNLSSNIIKNVDEIEAFMKH